MFTSYTLRRTDDSEILWFYAIVKEPWDSHYRVGDKVLFGESRNGLGSYFVLRETFTHACILPRSHATLACEICRRKDGYPVFSPEDSNELLETFRNVREVMLEAASS